LAGEGRATVNLGVKADAVVKDDLKGLYVERLVVHYKNLVIVSGVLAKRINVSANKTLNRLILELFVLDIVNVLNLYNLVSWLPVEDQFMRI